MKTLNRSIFLFLPLLALLVTHPLQTTIKQKNLTSATPTYDPLEEPLLSENPTEVELGRNLYWHWCMTCHGDRGQGLTDEFRSIWEPEHQNCWGRGCHAGRAGDEGFPIPTIVPALVNDTHLAEFASMQELSDFLETTHPPQSPGILKNEEYHAISLFVFTMNGRSLIDISVAETPSPTFIPTSTLVLQESADGSFPIYAIVILTVMLMGIFLLAGRTRLHH